MDRIARAAADAGLALRRLQPPHYHDPRIETFALVRRWAGGITVGSYGELDIIARPAFRQAAEAAGLTRIDARWAVRTLLHRNGYRVDSEPEAKVTANETLMRQYDIRPRPHDFKSGYRVRKWYSPRHRRSSPAALRKWFEAHNKTRWTLDELAQGRGAPRKCERGEREAQRVELVRLIAEAKASPLHPTQAELATALGVGERTIKRRWREAKQLAPLSSQVVEAHNGRYEGDSNMARLSPEQSRYQKPLYVSPGITLESVYGEHVNGALTRIERKLEALSGGQSQNADSRRIVADGALETLMLNVDLPQAA